MQLCRRGEGGKLHPYGMELGDGDVNHFADARVLVVDDEQNILDAYQHVLREIVWSPPDKIVSLAAELFDEPPPASSGGTTIAAVDFCRQGEDAVREIEEKQGEGTSYPVAFIDMRMPPGIDGLETAKRLRQVNPSINIVVVTGYSDHAPRQIASEIGCSDRLFYLVKPFNADELLQLTVTLINRWNSEKRLADELATKIAELDRSTAALKESEDRARKLRENIDELVGQLRDEFIGKNSAQVSADEFDLRSARVAGEQFMPMLRYSEAHQAAFQEGRAAAGHVLGLGLCPYSAVNEAELFSAWIAGYKSGPDNVS